MADSSGKLPARRPRAMTPKQGMDTRTPLPPTAIRTPVARLPHDKPRIGFLHWQQVRWLKNTYCLPLYHFFTDLEKRGEIHLTTLGETENQKGAPPFPRLEDVKAAELDGIVTNGIWNVDFLSRLAEMKIPAVSCDHDPGRTPLSVVIFDGIKGGEEAGKILLAHGHTDILCITRYRYDNGAPKGADPWAEDSTCQERRGGVQRALVGSDAEYWPVIQWRSQAGAKEMEDLYGRLERIVAEMGRWPTAIVGPDVGSAAAVRDRLVKQGLRSPEQVSVMGFFARSAPEDMETAKKMGVSYMNYSWEEMAQAAWNILLPRLNGTKPKDAPPERVLIAPSYVDMGSVAPRRQGK